MSITHRLGCFFLLVGGLIFMLFLASDMAARTPEYPALWISLPILGIGFLLWRKGRPKARPSGRFRLINKMRAEKKPPEERRHGS